MINSVVLVSGVQQSDSVTHTNTHTHTHTHIYIYIHSFSYSFPLWFITGYGILFPVLCSRTLLFIRSIYNTLHLLIPNSQCHPSPH